MNQVQKIGLLIWMAILGLTFSVCGGVEGLSDSLLQIDSKANKQYQKWTETNKRSHFEKANTAYISVFTSSPKGEKYAYALKVARMFYSNREDAVDIKEWYLRAINAFNTRAPELNNGLTPYQILEEKYALVLEFTKLYSKVYGKCEDAVEVLRVYKTEYSFKYIHYNRGLDQTDKIWLRLVQEDRYLSWECIEKQLKY